MVDQVLEINRPELQKDVKAAMDQLIVEYPELELDEDGFYRFVQLLLDEWGTVPDKTLMKVV